MSSRRLSGRTLLPLALLSLGCVTHLQPTVPMGARSGDVDLQLKQLNVFTGREFVLESRSHRPHRIERGWLTVPTRVPCSGGEPVDKVAVDGVAASRAALPPGTHELRVSFFERNNEFTLDLVLDLRLADGACLRTPVISQSLPLEVRRRPMLSLSTGLLALTELSGLEAVIGYQVGVATWAGRFLLNGEVGPGVSACAEGVCGPASKNHQASFTLPMQADVSYRLGESVSDMFLVGLRYSYFPIRLSALDGERRFSVHGGHATLIWASGISLRGAVIHQERRPLYQFVIPVGVLWEPGANKTAFTLGIAVRLLLPL